MCNLVVVATKMTSYCNIANQSFTTSTEAVKK